MKHYNLTSKAFCLLLSITSIIYAGNVNAQSSFMDRQTQIMKKENVKKVKRSSAPKKRYYAKKTSKSQENTFVDNSSYYSGDVSQDISGGLHYYTVSYDNHNEYGNNSINAHVEINYPKDDNINLNNIIKNWINSKIEDGNTYFSAWLMDKYPNEEDADGEHLLEYYNDVIYKSHLNSLKNTPLFIDSIIISLSDENDRYVSYSCRKAHNCSIYSPNIEESFSNASFRKSDGKRYNWDIIDESKLTALRASLKDACTNLAKEENNQETKNEIEILLNSGNDFPLPEASPIFTEEGLEFDYLVNGYGKGIRITLPYESAKPLMTDDAIATALDNIGEMDINGIVYNINKETASVVKLDDKRTENVTVPKIIRLGERVITVTSLGNRCFENCNNLKNIILQDNITTIGNECFKGCANFVGISIPSSVKKIGYGCFENCTNFTYAYFSKSMISLGDRTFKNCTKLLAITIPGNIRFVGNECFSGCSKLSFLKIENGVEAIGDSCFYDCNGLMKASLPTSVVKIGNASFRNCQSLNIISSLDGVKELGYDTFRDCNSLSEIKLPAVASIGNNCFYGCTNLKEVSLPIGLQKMPEGCFNLCRNLFSIGIPSTVNKIGKDCFGNCSSLSVVICYWQNIDAISINTDEFNSIGPKPYLLIPYGSKRAYKETLPWKNFDTIKEMHSGDEVSDIQKTKDKAREHLLYEKAERNF